MKKFNPLLKLYQGTTYTVLDKFQMILSALILFSIFLSCDNFIDVELPNSQLTANSVYEDKTTANAAMTQVYAKMRDSGLFTGYAFGLSNLMGNYTDELAFYGNPQEGTTDFYNGIVLPSNSSIKSLWNNSYNQIYGANAILEGVANSANLLSTDRDQLKGEALFTRALIHFYLANLFGSIPYIRTTDYQKNSMISKEPANAVYGNCIEDLNLAVALLPGTYKSPDRTRPNKFSARALLSRVYLYTQQWDEASNEASAVLNNTALYSVESNLNKTFLKESTATIWQFSPNTATGNSLEAQTFVFTVGPPPLSALTTTLVNTFTTADKRKLSWIASVTKEGATWYYSSKYKSKITSASTEYSVLLRLSEMYLIRAEARAHAGDLIGSKEDLNVIRNTAGLLNTTAISQSEILEAILKERQLEFFCEFGHRFFDLKRFNALDTALPSVKPGWSSYKAQLPLPESELLLNKNLIPQNTGY
ncbi:RagB/SusD family nutrient uptake outer membrane protein [Flavobacterium sp. FlaQc-47]|uniref:RagB/SusD family nutrient uptake outer membrane protein n=1 Tax=Flavobacterium sp. FlaQc-47 TaxID=3374180 RepID=UPI0037569FEB